MGFFGGKRDLSAGERKVEEQLGGSKEERVPQVGQAAATRGYWAARCEVMVAYNMPALRLRRPEVFCLTGADQVHSW